LGPKNTISRAADPMIAITHTPTDGTVLEGTTRGDGTNQLLNP
jgi:hypothetical protein